MRARERRHLRRHVDHGRAALGEPPRVVPRPAAGVEHIAPRDIRQQRLLAGRSWNALAALVGAINA
jgi:hypothetical protein